ncbi:MAG: FAD-dependent oxidoreductase [Pseudomonadota bacterium]
MSRKTEFDIGIIGGGAAGLVVAAGAATLGAKAVMVEKNALGGDCLYYGCVPSKTLLHSAKTAHIHRSSGRFGIPPTEPNIKLGVVMDRVQEVIRTIEPNDSPERFRAMGVNVIFGEGRFIDTRTFDVAGVKLNARKFVLATGTRPAVPPIEGIETVPYLTNETVFSLRENVSELIVVGAGPIGCEMAQAFARLGTRVHVVDIAPQILIKEDADMADVVQASLRRDGVQLYLGHTFVRVEGKEGDIRVLLMDRDRREIELHGSHLLVAAGRKPNLENLGLEKAGVGLENGRLISDKRLRTTNKNIYACGDVVGPYLFTHMAEHHAGVVLRNALFHFPAHVESRVIPWCTYTDPELARVGLSETEARQLGIDYRIYTFPFADVDRAIAEGETSGMAKIIASPRGRLLGAAIVGPHAGELIHEYVLALAKGMKLSDLSSIIHIYPTLAQINRRAADQRLKEALTPARRKWIKRLFGLRGAV